MDASILAAYIAACAALTFMPGPDIAFVIAESLARGRRTGYVLSCGLCSGVFVHTFLCASGVALAIAASPALFSSIRVAGAAYLLWLARGAFLENASEESASADFREAVEFISAHHAHYPFSDLVHDGFSLEQAEDAMKRLQQLYDNKSLPEIKYVEAQTKLEQARSMEEVARKNLDDSRLSAPFGGVIGQRQVETGENVLPGQTVYTLLKTDVVKIKIPVPENEISNIGSQSRARITVAALDGRTYEGTVQEKGVTANPVSHTYEAKIPLRNADGALMPGMVCRVTMESDSSARAIVLPNRAVQVTGRGERFVWCVRDGRAALVPVTVGALTETGVVVTGGLAGGEQVIVDGYQKVSDGMNVDVL